MKKVLVIAMALFVLYSCDKEQNKETSISLNKVSGFVQKGPFLNGTAITISELTSNLNPTGKSFSSQIINNNGMFELQNVNLSSQYIELKADGFYFNEVNNSNSEAQLTLFALSDLLNKADLNVNVLSNLEKNRVNYLVLKGSDFNKAKKQAQADVLSIFEIYQDDMSESEVLDITQPGDENAILLAVSVILQGNLSVSDLSELLANISTDIREDGKLDSKLLGSILINNAKTINLEEIRNNLKSRYNDLGLDINIPNFEKYINNFIENTSYEFTDFIQYPANGSYGINILDREKTDYPEGTYSFKAILPEESNLKVKVNGRNLFFPATQDNPGWECSTVSSDSVNYSRIFTTTRTGEVDLKIILQNFQDSAWSNQTNIFVYENDALEPTWKKEINVK